MVHNVAKIPKHFQWPPKTAGKSLQQDCNMASAKGTENARTAICGLPWACARADEERLPYGRPSFFNGSREGNH
jgi:hypothetical protein